MSLQSHQPCTEPLMQPWRLSGAGATLPHIWSQLPWRGCDRAPTILYSLLLCPKQLTPLSQLHSSFHNIMLYLSVLFLFLFFNLKTITSSTLRIPPSNKLIKKNNRVCLWPKGLREQRALRNVRVSCLRPCVCVCTALPEEKLGSCDWTVARGLVLLLGPDDWWG